jgi:hypothetical protein
MEGSSMRSLERVTICMLGILTCVLGLGLVGCGSDATCVLGGGIVGCGGDDDEDNLSGTYRGTMQDSLVGTGTITATLAQTDSTVTGTFQTSFPEGNGGGNVSGTRRDDALTLTVTPPQPPACPLTVTATIDGDKIQGTYATGDCPVVETGTVTLTRQ